MFVIKLKSRDLASEAEKMQVINQWHHGQDHTHKKTGYTKVTLYFEFNGYRFNNGI